MPNDVDRRDRAQALADPTRARLWDELRHAGAARTVTELAAVVGVGEATVRKHLDRLAGAGMVERAQDEPVGAGRPRLRYRAAPVPAPTSEGPDAPYEQLASWLLSMRRRRESPAAAGRRIAAGIVHEAGDSPAAAVARAMADDGFEPTVEATPDGSAITFHRCPYASAVLTDARTVCALHRGIAEGIVRDVGGARVTGLEIHDPVVAGCRLLLSATHP